MLQANIRILRKGQSVPPEDQTTDFMEILSETPWDIAILEDGTAAGNASVAIMVETPDGVPARHVLLQTSLALLANVVVSARAAFPEAFPPDHPLADDPDRDAVGLAQVEALVQVTAGLAQSQGVSLHDMALAIRDQVKATMEERGQ